MAAAASNNVFNVTTNFSKKESGLSVAIETGNLFMRSLREEDLDNYEKLYEDSGFFQKPCGITPNVLIQTVKLIWETWINRWHNNDPFSAIVVFKKGENGDKVLIGNIVLEHTRTPGEAELVLLFHKIHGHDDYKKEAVGAIVNEYAQQTIIDKYKLNGETLKKITARVDQIAAEILEAAGMQRDEEGKNNAISLKYSLDLSTFKENYSAMYGLLLFSPFSTAF